MLAAVVVSWWFDRAENGWSHDPEITGAASEHLTHEQRLGGTLPTILEVAQMTAHTSRIVALDSVLNFRDVGDFVSQLASPRSSPPLQPGRLYRSARLDEASAEDRNVLVNDLGVKTVIDLRSKTEHINAAKKYSAAAVLAQPEGVPSSNSQVAEPLKIPGLRYEEINLNGKGFERALVWQLSYYSLGRLVFLMVLGMSPPESPTA